MSVYRDPPPKRATGLLAYLRSCEGGLGSLREVPAVQSVRLDPDSLDLTADERRRFALGLLEIASVSLASGQGHGSLLPTPEPVRAGGEWVARLELLRREFLAADGSAGLRQRIVRHLDWELYAGRDARRRALRCVRLARQLDPDSERAALAHAIHRCRRRGTHRGVVALRELAREARDPDVRARAWLALGSLALARGEEPRATTLLRRACSLDPRDPETWARLAFARLALGDAEGGAEALREVANLAGANPSSPAGHAALGFLRSPEVGFPRLFAATGVAVSSLRASHPALATALLEAVAQPPRGGCRRTPRPERFLGVVRCALRVPFAALVAFDGAGGVSLAWEARPSYGAAERAVASSVAAGGAEAILRRALEEGDTAIARGEPGSLAGAVNAGARGAAAARVPAVLPVPVFLVIESDRLLVLDPERLSELAEDAVGPASALWLAHRHGKDARP